MLLAGLALVAGIIAHDLGYFQQVLDADESRLCILIAGLFLAATDPPPQKWSDLKYVLWHQGGSEHAKEETHA